MYVYDLHNEQVLGSYLDEYFYPRVNISNFSRVRDMNQQFAGIDVQFNINNRVFLVDEKGYLSKPTIQNTFVLELSFNNSRNERVEGWFYNLCKQSTHYLLCWADRDNINIYKERLEVRNFHRVEVMLVNRILLQNYMYLKYGISGSYINQNHYQLMQNLIFNQNPIYLPNSKSRYFLTTNRDEMPLNIVMPKNEYLASGAVEARYMVYRDRIENLL